MCAGGVKGGTPGVAKSLEKKRSRERKSKSIRFITARVEGVAAQRIKDISTLISKEILILFYISSKYRAVRVTKGA
jgi:hypothetical protein